LYNNIIEVVYSISERFFELGWIDEEIFLYGLNFIEETPVPQEVLNRIGHPTHSIQPLVRASINLDTGERIILGGKFIVQN
jgi:hypothetical protein